LCLITIAETCSKQAFYYLTVLKTEFSVDHPSIQGFCVAPKPACAGIFLPANQLHQPAMRGFFYFRRRAGFSIGNVNDQ
jgi:hypothetical protein